VRAAPGRGRGRRPRPGDGRRAWLAALSLAGNPDPGQFAAGFSGSEGTVAEYLLAEVLDRQPGRRRLLLRTSILPRVNSELADLLTGGDSGQRILQDLEQGNAFVVSLDVGMTEFRYHQMFAGLLALARLDRRAAGRRRLPRARAPAGLAGEACRSSALGPAGRA
jgi:LuxR family maltose regulon positive regulatory protein